MLPWRVIINNAQEVYLQLGDIAGAAHAVGMRFHEGEHGSVAVLPSVCDPLQRVSQWTRGLQGGSVGTGEITQGQLHGDNPALPRQQGEHAQRGRRQL